MASLFLSRCERNTEINEFLAASSVSLPPSEQLMPVATSIDCLLIPVPRGSLVCSPILLLTLIVCLGQGSAPKGLYYYALPKGENAHTNAHKDQIRCFFYGVLKHSKLLWLFININFLPCL
jgi:hypothetical protein